MSGDDRIWQADGFGGEGAGLAGDRGTTEGCRYTGSDHRGGIGFGEDVSGEADSGDVRSRKATAEARRHSATSSLDPRSGFVSLVGAGPGDPELITVRGLRVLRTAEVVVYDRLIHPGLLAEIPENAERVFVGKGSGFAVMSQRAIEAVLVEMARAGKRVVRLKGGDPFVFGRGAEEAEALAAAGIPFETVPGLSSAVAVPAAAGVPVTHRELASHFTVVTGHEDPDKAQSGVDWDWLARSTGTVVVLMGLERLPAIAARLIHAGRDPRTPSAAIASGTLPRQQAVFAPLSDLPEAVTGAGLRSPAILVIGEVARFPEILTQAGLQALATAV